LLIPGHASAIDDLDRLYIINSLGENLTMVDRAGDSVVTNLMPLGGCPNRIRAHNGLLFVVNSCTDDLMVIIQSTHAVVRTVHFPSGDNPWDIAIIDDSLCAVSMLLTNEVAIVNYQEGNESRRFAVGAAPEGLLYAYGRLWVANCALDFGTFAYGQGTVSISNELLTATVTSVNVGANPQVLALGNNGEVHVMCTGNYFDRFGEIYTLDPDSWLPTDSIDIGDFPGDLVVGPEGRGYLAGGGFVDSGFVFRYETGSHTLLNGPANPWKTAQGVLSITPRAEGGVFALAFGGDTVTEMSLQGALVRAWPVGDGPGYATHVTNRIPGDINQDGIHNVQDVVGIVGLAFRGEPSPERPEAADVNGDCVYSIVDVVKIVSQVFRGGDVLYWGCAE
jgi:hypothetical protein